MRSLEIVGAVIVWVVAIAFVICVLISARGPRKFNTDGPVYTKEELRKMDEKHSAR